MVAINDIMRVITLAESRDEKKAKAAVDMWLDLTGKNRKKNPSPPGKQR